MQRRHTYRQHMHQQAKSGQCTYNTFLYLPVVKAPGSSDQRERIASRKAISIGECSWQLFIQEAAEVFDKFSAMHEMI